MRLWCIIAKDVSPGATLTVKPGAPVTLPGGATARVIGEVEDVKVSGTDALALIRIDNEAAFLPSGAHLSMTDAVSLGLRPESLRPKDEV